MDKVTVSAKYQIVIPRAIRERFGIRPGQQVQLVPYADRIEIIPVRSAREMRGFVEGPNTFERDADRL